MSEELKPCPFCGEELVEVVNFSTRSGKYFAHPTPNEGGGCIAQSIIVRTNEPKRVAAWNHRADPTQGGKHADK